MRHRFHSICPYFAMFPESFAERWIGETTTPGQVVLDPFAGRGTAPFQALLMDRDAIGGDINPVAYVLTGAKLQSPSRSALDGRVDELERGFRDERWRVASQGLPPFFRRAFHHSTLRQVLHLRSRLDWKASRVDRFLAALCLGSLHGEMDKSRSYFSNQMPRTISTKPRYSLAFWNKHGLWPEKRDVFAILRERIKFRYASPRPRREGRAFLADARRLSRRAHRIPRPVSLIVTSPPYLNVTNFEEDQWLRLWFLGGPPDSGYGRISRDDRHERGPRYWSFVCAAWRGVRDLLADKAHFVCRIGGTGFQPEALKDTLLSSLMFLARRRDLVRWEVSSFPKRQTDLFRPGAPGCRFEVDVHVRLSQ